MAWKQETKGNETGNEMISTDQPPHSLAKVMISGNEMRLPAGNQEAMQSSIGFPTALDRNNSQSEIPIVPNASKQFYVTQNSWPPRNLFPNAALSLLVSVAS